MKTLKKPVLVWKKAWSISPRMNWTLFRQKRREVLVLLLLPAGTRVVGPRKNEYDTTDYHDTRKCRADKAVVVGLFDGDGKQLPGNIAYADFVTEDAFGKSHAFKYKVGAVAEPSEPFDTSGETCGSGIHFFHSYDDARSYTL